ncbi:DUF2752 domain-containing protein [Oscillatoria amoena NRMC-F 0135]|nr:DUF2752 domain-containing protein [Oscillatoria amoena NRMC-F 0135]
MFSKLRMLFHYFPAEAVTWTVALVALAFYQPDQSRHFTLCPLSAIGFDFCPGCGLGHSIAWLFKGAFVQSWQAHPLGLFAVIVLTYRIISLTIKSIKPYGKNC